MKLVSSLLVLAIVGEVVPVAAAAAGQKERPDSNAIPMVRVAPGSFYMGSDNGADYEKPAHRVTINYTFEIGKTEVTQGQWKAIMGDNPSGFSQCGDNCPVDSVSYEDALRFIKLLNIKTGLEYRLPTEAEWEYACKAGQDTTYCGGEDLDLLAWYGLEDSNIGGWKAGNSGDKTSQVAKKKPNAWGLYDMSGNVWEWVQDCISYTYDGAPTDGSARMTSGRGADCSSRVLRGGSWTSVASGLRAAVRLDENPQARDNAYGFRLSRKLP